MSKTVPFLGGFGAGRRHTDPHLYAYVNAEHQLVIFAREADNKISSVTLSPESVVEMRDYLNRIIVNPKVTLMEAE